MHGCSAGRRAFLAAPGRPTLQSCYGSLHVGMAYLQLRSESEAPQMGTPPRGIRYNTTMARWGRKSSARCSLMPSTPNRRRNYQHRCFLWTLEYIQATCVLTPTKITYANVDDPCPARKNSASKSSQARCMTTVLLIEGCSTKTMIRATIVTPNRIAG